MSNPRNIAAWTARTHPFPEYVSLNVVDAHYELTVRAPARICDPTPEYPAGFPVPGPTVTVALDPHVLAAFLTECVRNFRT